MQQRNQSWTKGPLTGMTPQSDFAMSKGPRPNSFFLFCFFFIHPDPPTLPAKPKCNPFSPCLCQINRRLSSFQQIFDAIRTLSLSLLALMSEP